jgi:hypothetical protein
VDHKNSTTIFVDTDGGKDGFLCGLSIVPTIRIHNTLGQKVRTHDYTLINMVSGALLFLEGSERLW